MATLPIGLTIASSDSGGGAGIQADLKSMQANGVFATSVLVASTAQNTHTVSDVHAFPLTHITAQLDAIAEDLFPDAVKTGMLLSRAIVELVADKVEEHGFHPLVVDPVMISKSGHTLLQDEAIAAVKTRLLPLATLVTPNAHEAARLADVEAVTTLEEAKDAARHIHALGPAAVLVKGGHLTDNDEAVDVLYDGETFRIYTSERIDTPHTHGTGCTYASAIAAHLAQGADLSSAVQSAKTYVTGAIRDGLALGRGHGPTDHFYFLDSRKPKPRTD